ncbi:pyrimidine/purine nucleoside phosphorylase [Aliarcobacter skirrowii]|uniref:pyrimidine/purine nucleoside phosphorylase n=1 Tax=Aliarcobacter skirrowii TaxID=28200 RepID=UPI0029AB34D8|nr:pyrimidine/purine nucleoside phosphorylase [Aliarcobacter skirrowii]MDX4060781.1 pyrimidine/purine nucleoside phosphorylase [Aliarcobacter skirrowii]
MENLNSFKGVELIKKANIYFDGNVTSRTFIDVDGSKKSLGIMMVGEYVFGTVEAEKMEIIEGEVEVRLKGEDGFKTYKSGSYFDVVANSSFEIKVKKITDYCCSYIN